MSSNHKLNKLVREGVDPEDIDDYYVDDFDDSEPESKVEEEDWQ